GVSVPLTPAAATAAPGPTAPATPVLSVSTAHRTPGARPRLPYVARLLQPSVHRALQAPNPFGAGHGARPAVRGSRRCPGRRERGQSPARARALPGPSPAVRVPPRPADAERSRRR